MYFRASSCHVLCLAQLFPAWDPDFKGVYKLGWEKNYSLI